MEKRFLTEKEQELFKKFLKVKDYKTIADHTGWSVSTVHDIVYGRTKVNANTENILKALNVVCYVRMSKDSKVISVNLRKLKKTEEVKSYNSLKDSEKWV